MSTTNDDDSGGELSMRCAQLEKRVSSLTADLDVPYSAAQGKMTILNSSRAVTPGDIYQLDALCRRLEEYSSCTKALIQDWLEREKLITALRKSQVMCMNDVRLKVLGQQLDRLSQLDDALLMSIHNWVHEFTEFIVTTATVDPNEMPLPVFVWDGRTCVERIQTDAAAIVRGDVHLIEDTEAARQNVGSCSTAAAGKTRSTVVPAGVDLPCPLVSATAVAHSSTANDVFREGPAPSWYKPAVAKAAMQALRSKSIKTSRRKWAP
jgi:hypothetical protein